MAQEEQAPDGAQASAIADDVPAPGDVPQREDPLPQPTIRLTLSSVNFCFHLCRWPYTEYIALITLL